MKSKIVRLGDVKSMEHKIALVFFPCSNGGSKSRDDNESRLEQCP